MKPRYKCLFLLLSIIVILEVTHCADEGSKQDISNDSKLSPKNRYIVEKTQNVTEKREEVPQKVDDDFQESFRKVRKVHKKLVNKKLHQYDETEDLERKRVKDSGETPKKNIEVQHVVQKLKILENPSYSPNKQNTDQVEQATSNASQQKENTADKPKTQKKETRSETVAQDDSKAEDGEENVTQVLPSTETKRKSLIDSKIEREEESDTADSPNTNQRKRILSSPERKGKKVIRTIYVTQGKNTHSKEEHDNLESEYLKLKQSVSGTSSHEKESGADKGKRIDTVESEEKGDQNQQSPSTKQKTFTDIEDEKNTENEEVKPSSDSDSRTKTRRIIIRRPIRIIRKNISRSAKEEEQKENRREEETFVDSEVVPGRRRKKIITTSETEKDQSKNAVEGSEDSETIIEKPEDQERVEHIIIKKRRRDKDTKRTDKSNTEDVEIITDSEEPVFESKTGTKRNRKKIVNIIDKTDLDSDKRTVKRNLKEKEAMDVSDDTEDTKQTADTPVEIEETAAVHTEKTVKRKPSQILETETVDKPVPSETKKGKNTIVISESEDAANIKTTAKPRKVRIIKKESERKDRAATAVTKSKAIAAVEEEIRQMLSEGSQTEKPNMSKQKKSPKQTEKTVIVTKKSESGSETHEDLFKPVNTYTNIVESNDKGLPVFTNKNEIITTETPKDNTNAPKTRTILKKPENVEVTTTTPRIILKDKTLTVIKVPQEDTVIPKRKLKITKRVHSVEPGTENANIDETQNIAIKKMVKPGASKHDTTNTKTDAENKITNVKTKNVIKPDVQIGSIEVTEADTDKKTTIIPYVIEPHSTTVKEISLTEPETQKEQIPTESEAENKVTEMDEVKVTKSPVRVLKKVIIRTQTDKDSTTMPETQTQIRPSYESETPASVIIRKDHDVSEIEHITNKYPDETESTETIEKTTSTTISESQKEQYTTKLKPEDETLKSDKEIGETSEPISFTVKKHNKIGPETGKEDTAVPEIDTKTERVEEVKDTVNIYQINTVPVKRVRKTDLETHKEDAKTDTETEEVKPSKETEKSPESSITVIKRIKKIEPETQKEVSEVGTGNTEDKLIEVTEKTPKSGTRIVKRLRKTDSKPERGDIEVDTNAHEAKTTKEAGLTPGPSTVTVRNVNKAEPPTQKEDTRIDSKASEPEESPKPSTKVVKSAKKIDLETQNDESKGDTEKQEVKKITETGKAPESRTVAVGKVNTIDSETQKNESEDDTKTQEIKPTKEAGKGLEPSAVIVKNVKKIDSEREADDSGNTKIPKVKTTKESKISPEFNEVQTNKETGESAGSDKVPVKKIRLIAPEKTKKAADIAEVDTKGEVPSKEANSSQDFERAADNTAVIVKKVRKSEPEIQKDDTEVDKKSNLVKPTEGYGAVVVKRTNKTDSEIHKDAANVPGVSTKPEEQSDESRLSKESNDLSKIRSTVVKGARKPDSEAEKNGADVFDVTTTVKKDMKLNDKSEKPPESRAIIKKSVISEPETATEDTEISNPEHELRKRSGRTEVMDTNTVIQPHTDEDHIKNGHVDNRKEKQYTISENIPSEAKTTQETVMNRKIVDAAVEKKRIDESGDKEKKDEKVIIRSNNISTPEKIPTTSSQVQIDRKAQGDQEELVEKDEIVTDTQVIEEEVDDDSAASQNVETASKQGSKVVKSGAQKLEHQPGMRSQGGILTKGSANQLEIKGAVGKVTARGKPHLIRKPSKKRRSPLKRREATEYLFLLENDAESTNLRDPSVAAELMSKLKVSKTQTYTTYHVNRGKEWSTNDDLSALMQRLQISAEKIQSVGAIGEPYLKNVQQLQRTSTEYIQDGYQASLGTQVKLQIKEYEKIQNAYIRVETALQSESNVLLELAIKAICEIRSGMFKMECFKEQYPVFEKFLSPAEPDKKDCYGNVRKLPEWTKAAPELWKNKERRLNKLQGSIGNFKKIKQELQPVQNIKKSIAAVICDIINYMDVQTKFLNFSTKLEGIAKLARREINICNKKEPIDPALADADK